MANKIQLRRDTAANWNRVNPILEDGEPGLDTTANQIKYGDGNTAWRDLGYSGGLPESDGVVTFPGDMLIGTLWPNDPVTGPTGPTGPSGPSGDKESVVWAKDDTEYLGLWWGGDQIYPEELYGPVAGIMIGYGEGATDDFVDRPAPEGTAITLAINGASDTLPWIFDYDGFLTFPTGGKIGPGGAKGEGTTFGGLNNHFVSLTSYYDSGNYSSCVTANADGSLYITTYNDGGENPSKVWTYGVDGTLDLPQSTVTGKAIIQSTYNIRVNAGGSLWNFDTDGNLTLPTGGEIHSTAGTGNVTIQASDGSNPRNFVFNTSGSITLPQLASGGQGNGSLDVHNNQVTLNNGDTVDFSAFSGMVLVNCYNSGCTTMFLCGGTFAASLGSSKGTDTGTMAYVSGISGYRFTATETGIHVFSAIRTRTIG
jgi:hypothetical protein